MKKQFFFFFMILALGAGFTACSNDDLGRQEGKEVARNADTYMSVTFTLPKANTTRAAADGQDGANPSFNNIGSWNGSDKIESVKIYVFAGNQTTDKLETIETVNNPVLTTSGGNVVVKSPQPFKISAGTKTVFVVVNPTTETDTHLNATAGLTTLSEFTAQYSENALALTPSGTASTSAEKLAVRTISGSDATDKITMTGAPQEEAIAAGISSSQAASGAVNNVNLSVQRAVASVMVSTKEASYTFAGNNPATGTIAQDFVTVSDLSYVVAQGEKKLYLLQKANANAATDGAAFETPSYTYINSSTDYTTDAPNYYDYSGLTANEIGRKTNGFGLTTLTTHTLSDLTPNLPTKTVFVLPTVHKFNADRAQSGYRKGNTPYVLVRGFLTPKTIVDDNGDPKTPTELSLADDANLFYGETTGFFYKSLATSQEPTKKGVKGQKVRQFTKRVVLYWAWLNPDTENVNSPVIRNNIYNIHITAIKNLGGNWNPLVPGGNNPDPKPNNPNEPSTPPVSPEDPLTLDKTWMSTNVTILPWQVHSHEITLSL